MTTREAVLSDLKAARLKENCALMSISRRHFVKTAVMTGVASAFPQILVRKARAAWERKTPVHPNIDDLRVVGVTDPGMTKAEEPVSSWARQNELVDNEVVWNNIDKLADSLAGTGNPEHAWRAIFVKPPLKSWTDVVVAIKTNNIGRQHTRSAVMAKICRTLTDVIGVKPANIHIYDACHGGSMSRNTPFAGLPDGCRVKNKWGGSRIPVEVPEPWKDREGNAECLQHLTDGSVDILVNIAMCKGHSSQFGGFTMTMKNHFGTFAPSPGHGRNGTDYLIGINQTPEILGPMDKKTGRILYPRQQLCLIDALWAGKGGPGGNPTHQPNFLAMGVFSPVVDYQVATKFRATKMGWQPDMNVTRRFLTDFGYAENELPEGGNLILV